MSAPKRIAPEDLVDMTAMVDIVFFVLIFFMVTSIFMREKHIELQEAKAVEVETVEIKPISVVLDRNGEVWLQGTPCPKEALGPAVAALVADDKEKVVMVKIDKDQPQSEFVKILTAIGGAGADIDLLGQKEGK